MTNFTPRPALVAAFLIALVTGPAAAQGGNGVSPQLHVTRQGDTLSFALSDEPANSGDFWILQNSPVPGDWDDLMFLDENAEGVGSAAWWEGASHLFRARRLDADDRVLRAFLEARTTWRNAGIDSYTMEIDHQVSFLFWRGIVTVCDGEVTSAVPTETNFFEPPPDRTIDDWFDRLKQVIDQDPYRLVVTYNAIYGFPQFVDIDRALEIADDEEQWTISNFQIKP